MPAIFLGQFHIIPSSKFHPVQFNSIKSSQSKFLAMQVSTANSPPYPSKILADGYSNFCASCMILQTINMYIAVGIYFPLILSKYRQQNRIISLSVSLLIYLPIFIYLSTYKSSSILLSATRLKNTYIY